jgi:hypothetical protein
VAAWEQALAVLTWPSRSRSRTAPPAAAKAAWSAARSALCRAATAPIQTKAQAAVLDARRTIAMAQTVADPAWPRDGESGRLRIRPSWRRSQRMDRFRSL